MRMTSNERAEKLQYLTGCLIDEMPEYTGYRNRVPDQMEEAFDLYRALCNVRMPRGATGHTLPEKFYEVQAEVLQSITEEKGITDADSLPESPADARLSLWQGDITTLRADAVVNAANSQMLGCFVPLHGCIDNIIHTMAGVELREECYRIMTAQGHEEPTGSAKITDGWNLPAAHVLHTVGPVVRGPLSDRHRKLLASCYTSCLDLADENGLATVAFCCISTGVFMFPQDRAAETAVETVIGWLDRHPDSSVRKVVFNVFKDSDRELYRSLLA